MATEPSFSISEAARRTGYTKGRVRQLVGGKFREVPGEDPQRVYARQVNDVRSSRLSHFDGVLDLLNPALSTRDGTFEEASVANLREQVATLLEQLRGVVASRAVLASSIESVLRADQAVLDSLVAGLPVDPLRRHQ
jgi:hypothetical protein